MSRSTSTRRASFGRNPIISAPPGLALHRRSEARLARSLPSRRSRHWICASSSWKPPLRPPFQPRRANALCLLELSRLSSRRSTARPRRRAEARVAVETRMATGSSRRERRRPAERRPVEELVRPSTAERKGLCGAQHRSVLAPVQQLDRRLVVKLRVRPDHPGAHSRSALAFQKQSHDAKEVSKTRLGTSTRVTASHVAADRLGIANPDCVCGQTLPQRLLQGLGNHRVVLRYREAIDLLGHARQRFCHGIDSRSATAYAPITPPQWSSPTRPNATTPDEAR